MNNSCKQIPKPEEKTVTAIHHVTAIHFAEESTDERDGKSNDHTNNKQQECINRINYLQQSHHHAKDKL